MKRNDGIHPRQKTSGNLHLLIIVIFIFTITGCDLLEDEEQAPDYSEEIEDLVESVSKFEEPPEQSPQVIDQEEEITTTEEIEGNQVITSKWKCTYTTYSASENPDNFMMLDPLSSVLWPGNLVQGNSLAGGVPNSVPIENRAQANITLAIVSGDQSGTEQEFTREVEKPAASSVTQAMNEILSGYQGGTPAKYSYSLNHIYNATHFNFALKAGYSGPTQKVNGSLNLDWENKKKKIAVKLHQQFFTMIMDDPQGPSGVFGPEFTPDELEPYVGPGNPLCYISSVTYGRMYVLVYETESSRTELEAALNYAYNGQVSSGTVETEADFEKIMKEVSVKVHQIGGDPEAGLDAASALSYDKIRDFMVEGANFSSDNVGLPISYTVKYLKDASLVRMNITTEYTVPQCDPEPMEVTKDFTKSKCQFFFKKTELVSDNNDGDGIQIKIFTIDENGNENVEWAGPTNHDGDDKYGAFYDLGYPTLSEELNWDVPTFTIDNNPDQKIKIKIGFNDYDNNTGREWNFKAINYKYKEKSGKNPELPTPGFSIDKGWQSVENISYDGTFNYADIKNQDGNTKLRIYFTAEFTDIGAGE